MSERKRKTRGRDRDTSRRPEKFEYCDWNQRVIDLLDSRGIRQTELVEKLHVTYCTVHHMLFDKPDVKLSTLFKIADVLNVPADWLLYGDAIYEPRPMPEEPLTLESVMSDLDQVLKNASNEEKIRLIEKIVKN